MHCLCFQVKETNVSNDFVIRDLTAECQGVSHPKHSSYTHIYHHHQLCLLPSLYLTSLLLFSFHHLLCCPSHLHPPSLAPPLFLPNAHALQPSHYPSPISSHCPSHQPSPLPSPLPLTGDTEHPSVPLQCVAGPPEANLHLPHPTDDPDATRRTQAAKGTHCGPLQCWLWSHWDHHHHRHHQERYQGKGGSNRSSRNACRNSSCFCSSLMHTHARTHAHTHTHTHTHFLLPSLFFVQDMSQEMSVYEIVKRLRTMRPAMVQARVRPPSFCHTAQCNPPLPLPNSVGPVPLCVPGIINPGKELSGRKHKSSETATPCCQGTYVHGCIFVVRACVRVCVCVHVAPPPLLQPGSKPPEGKEVRGVVSSAVALCHLSPSL